MNDSPIVLFDSHTFVCLGLFVQLEKFSTEFIDFFQSIVTFFKMYRSNKRRKLCCFFVRNKRNISVELDFEGIYIRTEVSMVSLSIENIYNFVITYSFRVY